MKLFRITFLLVAFLPVGVWEVGADGRDGVADGQLVLGEARQVHKRATR
jgi:hypothetical protein